MLKVAFLQSQTGAEVVHKDDIVKLKLISQRNLRSWGNEVDEH